MVLARWTGSGEYVSKLCKLYKLQYVHCKSGMNGWGSWLSIGTMKKKALMGVTSAVRNYFFNDRRHTGMCRKGQKYTTHSSGDKPLTLPNYK